MVAALPIVLAALGAPSGSTALTAYDSVLDRSNTRRLRIALNFDTLHQETALPYAACFKVGDWYRRGFPSPQPPADGIDTCPRDSSEWSVSGGEGCWGRCLPADLVTAGARAILVHVTTVVAAQLSDLLSIEDKVMPPPERSTGTPGYHWAFQPQGYDMSSRCEFDCQVISGVTVPDGHCDPGDHPDAVLSVTKPPVFDGIRGAGSSCSHAADGRPRWLVFDWIEGMSDKALWPDCQAGLVCITPEEAIERWKGLVLHEILHALGFSIGKFYNAREPTGAKKNLLELVRLTDMDGEEDDIWHFREGTRAASAAQLYFGCDSGAWHGLPLMGKPDVGRNSHWETRIMRDDVMSYGQSDAVSSITLAALEDLGFYLANYSGADCMSWGYKQGCDFVATRCGQFASPGPLVGSPGDPVPQEQCRGNSHWLAYMDPYLQQKCGFGADPCSSPYEGAFDGVGCSVQCFTGDDDSCVSSPRATSVEKAGPRGGQRAAGVPVMAIWALNAALAGYAFRDQLLPTHGSVRVISAVALLSGGLGVVVSVLAVFAAQWTPVLVSWQLAAVAVTTGGMLISICLLSIGSVRLRSRLMGRVARGVQGIVIFLEVVGLITLALWGIGRVVGVSAVGISAMVCGSYQLCCNPGGEICLAEARWPWEDPAHPKFCQFAAGMVITPSRYTCEAATMWLPDFDPKQCQDTFCASGLEGYLDFEASVRIVVLPSCLAICIVVAVQVVLTRNLRRFTRSLDALGPITSFRA